MQQTIRMTTEHGDKDWIAAFSENTHTHTLACKGLVVVLPIRIYAHVCINTPQESHIRTFVDSYFS